MVGLFTFDGPMYRDCNGIYCNTTITNEMLNRYFSVIDKLKVLIRTIPLNGSYTSYHLNKVEISSNLEIIELPNLNSPINFLTRRKFISIIEEIISEVDLCFLRIPSIISNMAADICKKQNKPYLVEVGGCAWDSYFNHSILGKIIAPYMFFKQRSTVKDAFLASYVTEKWLQKRYPTKAKKSIVASNVYLQNFDEENINRRIEIYNNSSKVYKLGTIAAVDVPYKGQAYIIKALKLLKEEGIILHYELVGRGDESRLKKLAYKYGIEDQIHFLGTKLHEDIWDWLDQIDIYAQPSKQEGLPRAVIEAMNRGCLVIGSDTAGIPELIEEDMIFKSGDIKQIVNIIKSILTEKDFSLRIKRNFERTKSFDLDLLKNRRRFLFEEFKESVQNSKIKLLKEELC